MTAEHDLVFDGSGDGEAWGGGIDLWMDGFLGGGLELGTETGEDDARQGI